MIRKAMKEILTGLSGAAVLNIVIILALPGFTGLDAYSRLTAYDSDGRFVLFDSRADEMGFSNGDPYLRTAACVISVETQPVHLLAAGAVPFWSFAVFDSASNEVFSMNDRTSVAGDLDVLVATPVQVAQLRKTPIAALAETIHVEHPGTEG